MIIKDVNNNNQFIKGIIVDTNDPKQQSRYKVRIPCYHGSGKDPDDLKDDKLPWAQTCLQNKDAFTKGDTVWLSFEGGDTRFPVIFGQLGSTAKFPSSSGSSTGKSKNGNIKGGEYEITIDGKTYYMGGSTLADYGVCLIKIHECGSNGKDISDESYSAINGYDIDGPSIGIIQWHNEFGANLLKRIRDKNSSNFNSIAPEISAELNSNQFGYSGDCLTSGSSRWNEVAAVLCTDEGKKVQDEMAKEFVQNYIDLGTEAGIIDNGALLYHADICNTGPYIDTCVQMRSASDKTLDNFYNIAMANSSDSSRHRRELSYKIIKELEKLGALKGSGGSLEGSGDWLWPCPDCKSVSSDYGNRTWDDGSVEFHKGIDIPAGEGSTIYASCSGTVEAAGESARGYNDGAYVCGGNGYGYVTIIRNDDGNYFTLYGHQSQIDVNEGDVIKAGDPIGAVGNTGASCGAHLHFEVRDLSTTETVDPKTCLNMEGVDVTDD